MMTMITFLPRLLLLLFLVLSPFSNAELRAFEFDAQVKYIDLRDSLPNTTAIYHEWPPKKLRTLLPKKIAAAVIISPTHGVASLTDDKNLALVGPPIHVQTGDVLSVRLKNSLQTTGLSIHWHGFEMADALEYDGVVGVTQCPITPGTSFLYEFLVNETPGTYWWHTHSGVLGIHATNGIHGPLIVHPKGDDKKRLVDVLNGDSVDNATSTSTSSLFDATSTSSLSFQEGPWFYENERILFFKDGFLTPDAIHLEANIGGLNEATSKNDAGWTVGTSAWEFGTCNGKLREIVPVSAGETYRFRLINGGIHYGFHISIANLKMKVLAADSEQVVPNLVVDEVFLHAAERFDVEITIPDDWEEGSSFWIRADTSESKYQGYENGVRAILSVSDNSSGKTDLAYVKDPVDRIESLAEGRSSNYITLNCFEREPTLPKMSAGGTCIPITSLLPAEKSIDRGIVESQDDPLNIHIIDAHFQPPPQHSHFVRFDDGHWYQHVNPVISMLDPVFNPMEDFHPNTAMLHVPAYSTVVLVWRTTSLMDHPMHLHGLKMEILDIALPKKKIDCTLAKCKLNSAYESHADVRALASRIPPGRAVLKDTFILPAGGAVVTRIFTYEPSVWFAHCHLEVHKDNGMAFILNVGNYSASSSGLTLASDFPSCNSPLIEGHLPYPSCDCYENPNLVLDNFLTSDYKCSRHHLCHHVHSRAANLNKYPYAEGDELNSDHEIPGWGIALIFSAGCVGVAFITCSGYFGRKEYVRRTTLRKSMRASALMREIEASCISSLNNEPKMGEISQNENEANEEEADDYNENDTHIVSARQSKPRSSHPQANNALDEVYIDKVGEISQNKNEDNEEEADDYNENDTHIESAVQATPRSSDDSSSFFIQLKYIAWKQYSQLRPVCISPLRVFEVLLLGFLTGSLFWDVGNNRTFSGFSQKLSLFFFSTTLWTFTRMYPHVTFGFGWFHCEEFKTREFNMFPAVLSRILVILVLESFWPMIYVFVCYPIAGIFGSVKTAFMVGLFLVLNNLCYIALGLALGAYFEVAQGMIASTILSQTSLVAAGFFTKLPRALDWIKYISPFYWSFRGIIKSCLKWNDSIECFKGSSDVGATQCHVEYHAAIDQYKERGINVATYNDPTSENVHEEYLCLVALLIGMYGLVFVRVWYVYYKK